MFTLVFPKDSAIYKGFENASAKFDHNSKNSCWFALEKDKAIKYGNYVYGFQTSKTMRFINISSSLFKLHFTDQINISNLPVEKHTSVLHVTFSV